MLQIRINNIKVLAISNLGSLNIGKVILCHNRAVSNFINRERLYRDQFGIRRAGAPVTVPSISQITPTEPLSQTTPTIPHTPPIVPHTTAK